MKKSNTNHSKMLSRFKSVISRHNSPNNPGQNSSSSDSNISDILEIPVTIQSKIPPIKNCIHHLYNIEVDCKLEILSTKKITLTQLCDHLVQHKLNYCGEVKLYELQHYLLCITLSGVKESIVSSTEPYSYKYNAELSTVLTTPFCNYKDDVLGYQTIRTRSNWSSTSLFSKTHWTFTSSIKRTPVAGYPLYQSYPDKIKYILNRGQFSTTFTENEFTLLN